jgi:hypothetical protein
MHDVKINSLQPASLESEKLERNGLAKNVAVGASIFGLARVA